MGAEMILYSVPYVEGLKPDWDAGFALIKNLEEEGHIIEDDSEFLSDELKVFKAVFYTGTRESSVLTIGGLQVIATGGATWGDDPTELCGTIGNLDEHGILEACGFYPYVPDYETMFNLVLEKAGDEVLPLLTGLDKDLDEIVKNKLK